MNCFEFRLIHKKKSIKLRKTQFWINKYILFSSKIQFFFIKQLEFSNFACHLNNFEGLLVLTWQKIYHVWSIMFHQRAYHLSALGLPENVGNFQRQQFNLQPTMCKVQTFPLSTLLILECSESHGTLFSSNFSRRRMNCRDLSGVFYNKAILALRLCFKFVQQPRLIRRIPLCEEARLPLSQIGRAHV